MGLHQHALLPLLGLAGLIFSGVHAVAPLRNLCPRTCQEAGPNPSDWTVIGEFSQLQACQRPMVLDFSVNIPVTEKQQIRVCNVFANDFSNRAASNITLASTDGEIETKQVNPQLAWTPAASEDEIGGRLVIQSVEHLKSYLLNNRKTSQRIMLFGTVSGTTVGVYVGANLIGSSVAGDLFDSFLNNLYGTGIADSEASLVQLCDGRSGNDVFGLIAASSATFSTVHDAVGRWSNGTCVDTSSYAETRELNATSISVIKPKIAPTPSNGTVIRGQRRDTYCRTVKVDDGDICDTLIVRCGGGLTTEQFYKYNPDPDRCTLLPGEYRCCTSGSMPDLRPKPNADGSCASYQIQHNDFCSKIAVANGLTVKELEDLNKETWGFNGCDYGFWADNWICLSEGTPRFPEPIPNAVCGPQKPGSTKPSGSTSRDWAKLNPCPLNACCNIWGQCGTTVDFCIDTNTGPPGTAKKDTYGCVSNCGMTIVRSGPPAQFIKLGYFEGFNLGRTCLNMDAIQVDPSFTHVHFAFGMITEQFEIYQEDVYAEFQFQQFKQITTAKRIISFGGWVFSAEAPNYPIFRNAVSTAANREKLATNLVKYVVDNGLDGLDIDWEYPSAPDLPDIPKGDLSEATNYLRLLASIKSKLPKDKSLSIAAPSSYWYLKQFPIKAMSELLDYVVFMTYDLHGQWDAGNEWANPGCPSGNCLRSHINRTETLSALTMITKAGVPSNKVLVGISSYGRSFQMVDPSCTGPSCLYTGDRKTSYARKGRCTETSGYLANAEINEIGGRTWMDTASNSMMMVDGDLWVSYMDDSLKASRTQLYKNYEMGGVSDWAVDLVQFNLPPYGDMPPIGSPPDVSPGGFYEKSWLESKNQMKAKVPPVPPECTASREKRTGTWVGLECTMPEAQAHTTDYPPADRWAAMDCDHAWEDAKCDDVSINTNCGTVTCVAHNNAGDLKDAKTGACAYEIWNSISAVHSMLKNYYYTLDAAGVGIRDNQDTFIETFAPKPEDGAAILSLFLSLLGIPLNIGLTRFITGDMMARPFASIGANPETFAEEVTGLVDVGSGVAQDAIQKASDAKKGVEFSTIYDALLGNWKAQVDTLITKIFDGSQTSIDILGSLFSGGKLIDGRVSTKAPSTNHTEHWELEQNVERAFYAAAIPAAWSANRPAPVVVDFGAYADEDNGCQIDARDYFLSGNPDQYNVGWRCINKHSYILAGVRDKQETCGVGPNCPATPKWTLDVLDGIGDIPDDLDPGETPKWAGVTVSDLIIGALNTYNTNGQKNIMDPTKGVPTHKSIVDEYNGKNMDIRRAGFIRIPVCSAEEAKANLAKGRAVYGTSRNYPCNA
ncbi:hypothetical protein V494_00922 [Pseudogymnoascus sp. VKM F-4513 (FW-928)]|nr:hypothetical protein V494_00922 [Pseudogymnoascus sp. VKM F-4513 (FW-928)]